MIRDRRKNYTTMTGGRVYHGEWIFEVVKAERIDFGTPFTDPAVWVMHEIGEIEERLLRTLIGGLSPGGVDDALAVAVENREFGNDRVKRDPG